MTSARRIERGNRAIGALLVAALFPAFLWSCDENAPEPPIHAAGLVVLIGDSITESWQISRNLIPVENLGIGGEETTDMARRFGEDVLSLQPDTVVILGGINDINRRGVADPRHVFEMVEKALAANAKVIVGTLPPAHGPGLNDEHLCAELIRSFNEELVSASRSYGYEVADFYTAMMREGIPDGSLFKDGVHPNGFGYARMWTVLRTVLAKNDLLMEPPSQ